MLNEKEREALGKAIDLANNSFYRMKRVLNLLLIKKDALLRFCVQQEQSLQISAEDIDTLISYLPQLETFSQILGEIRNIEETIPDEFKTFLQKEFVAFDWTKNPMDYSTNRIIHFLNGESIVSGTIAPEDIEDFRKLQQLSTQYKSIVDGLNRKISQYRIFERIKWIDSNIVMIGPNGSGKSTFSRQLQGKLSSNISILSAQHLLVYQDLTTIPISGDELSKLRSFQKNKKLSSDSNFTNLITSDMNQLITALFSEHTNKAYDYFDGLIRRASVLETVIQMWNELLEHRTLIFDHGKLVVNAESGEPYSFNSLSDGEKAVFYYISHVLMTDEHSYIIIDEPENHLNMAICNKLWDRLELARPDCKFIYLTHNPSFAVSRTNTTLIWNKKFVPPDDWDFEIISSDETMPDTLLVEVLGSRKNICFCEGKDKSSLDYKLYSALFPEYTVIPVGGHIDVINYTRAYNRSPICIYTAIGIIDGDCHLREQIDKWSSQKIYTLRLNEIENLLCDEQILAKAASVFQSPDDSVNGFYDLFWQELDRAKNVQVAWYVNNIINNRFKDNFLHEKGDIKNIKSELQSIISPDCVDQIYNDRLSELSDIIHRKDYGSALRIANFKGKLTKDIAKRTIVDKYPDRIIGLIKEDEALSDAIRQKYFSMIPNV